jgi:hypothetical protein
VDEAPSPVTWHLRESLFDGVQLVLDPAGRLFDEALDECVPSLVGSGGDLCSYWVETVIWRLQNWSDAPGAEQQITEGNTTAIVKVGEVVAARSLYSGCADHRLPVEHLLPALHAWRDRLVARGAARELPAAHRQVPIALPARAADRDWSA